MKVWVAHIFLFTNLKSHCFLFTVSIPLVNEGLQNYLIESRGVLNIGFIHIYLVCLKACDYLK